MKIAHIACQIPPIAGGIGNSAHHLATKLQGLGLDTTVFTLKSDKPVSNDKKYAVVELNSPVRVGLGAFLPQLIWKLWKFDIIHLHYPFLASNLIVALFKLLKGQKTQFVLHYHQDLNLKGIKKAYEYITRKLFLGFIINQADQVIYSSFDYFKTSCAFKYYQKNKSKFHELPFGVNQEYKPADKKNELLEKYGFTSEDKIVLFVGGLGRNHYFKGVDDLIKSFKLITDENIKCLIIGDGNLKQRYQALVKELSLENKVKFAGFVQDEQLSDHYNLSDIFILPSTQKNEAFGIVLIEAMAHGKPVIASNLPGVREVVARGNNGFLIEPGNKTDISQKVMELLNSNNYQEYCDNALQSVKKHYQWDSIVEKLINIYK